MKAFEFTFFYGDGTESRMLVIAKTEKEAWGKVPRTKAQVLLSDTYHKPVFAEQSDLTVIDGDELEKECAIIELKTFDEVKLHNGPMYEKYVSLLELKKYLSCNRSE